MKKYLITSPDYYTDTPSLFKMKLMKQFVKHSPDYVLYRDKENVNYEAQAKEFLDICEGFKDLKAFVHRKVDLAKKIGAKGVHLTSTQFDEITKAKELGLEVIISTHTHKEVLKAQELGADAVTYSPIFASPNKGKPKGVEDLEALIFQCNIKVFALGGIIDAKQIKLVEESGAYGFASIRYFYD